MMFISYFTFPLAILLFVSPAFCTPASSDSSNCNAATCLSDDDAATIAYNYGQLLSNFSINLAQTILSNTSFQDQSDSANTLIDGATQSPIPVCLHQLKSIICKILIALHTARLTHFHISRPTHLHAGHTS